VSPSGNQAGSGRQPDPTPLLRLATVYWEAQTFLTANRLGLFSVLADGVHDADAIAAELGTEPGRTALFLNACVALGLIERDDDGYRLSELSAAYLVPGGPAFLGDAVRYGDDMYDAWGQLERTLRDGRPVVDPTTYLGDDIERTRRFVHAMHARASGVARALVGLVDLAGRRRMLDVGGGPGTYAALFCGQNPELEAKVLELPAVAAIAREILDGMDGGDRVTVLPGDYLLSDFPVGNDVVLMSGVFHRESPVTCRSLIARASGSLMPGGTVVVSDVFTDLGGASPPFAALFGVNMMLSAPDGGVHADAEVARWMKDEGFEEIETRPFPPPMPHRVVLGRKGAGK